VTLLDRPLRAAILAASENALVRRTVTRYGMRLGARRFVAGQSVEEFLPVVREVNARGFAVAATLLGESVADRAEAVAVTEQYCRLLRQFAQDGLDANVAFKLTHVGLDIDPELAYENALRIALCAQEQGNTVRMDMEQSRYVDPTLAIYRRVRERTAAVGFVLQSYLYRSAGDLEALLPLAPSARIVKGAYLEPPTIAYPNKSDVDEGYLRLVRSSFSQDGFTAIATHDPKIVATVEELARAHGLPTRGRYEFQMLYGICEPLARSLVDRGYRVRLAVPYGAYWFPYLMRRLAERPANVAFFLKGAFARR
jgi:proline dehydrogenase